MAGDCFVKNIFCTGDYGGGDSAKSIVSSIIDITDSRIVMNRYPIAGLAGFDNKGYSETEVSSVFDVSFADRDLMLIKNWTYQLYKAYNSKSFKELADIRQYTHEHIGSNPVWVGDHWNEEGSGLGAAFARVTGVLPYLGKDEGASPKSDINWSTEDKNIIHGLHARIYTVYDTGISQPRMVFKVDYNEGNPPSYNPVKLNINKILTSGGTNASADFDIYDAGNVETIASAVEPESSYWKLSTNAFGNTKELLTIYPEDFNKPEIKLKFVEKNAPPGTGIISPFTIKLTCDYENGVIKNISLEDGDSNFVQCNSDTVSLTIKDPPCVKLNFKKQDLNNVPLSGANITVSKGEGVYALSNSPGKLVYEDNHVDLYDLGSSTVYVSPIKFTPHGSFEIKLNETTSPKEHYIADDEIKLTVYYDENGDVENITTDSSYIGEYNNGSGSVDIIIKNPPTVKLKFDKQSLSGSEKNLNATFTISGDDRVAGFRTTSTGDFAPTLVGVTSDQTVEVKPTNFEDGGSFTVKLEETKAPDGYSRFEGDIKLTITYNNKGEVTKVDVGDGYNGIITGELVTDSNGKVSIVVKDEPLIPITFYKQDFWGQPVETNNGTTTVRVTGDKNVKYINKEGTNYVDITSGNSGKFPQINVCPDDFNSGSFTIKLEETNVSTGMAKLTINLTVYYNNSGKIDRISDEERGYLELRDDSSEEDNRITFKNPPEVNLSIHKIDTLTKKKLPNVGFTIKLKNVVDFQGISEATWDGTYWSKTVTTNENGDDIVLGNIIPADPTQPVEAIITETKAPDPEKDANGNELWHYKALEGPITVKMTYNPERTYTYEVTYDGSDRRLDEVWNVVTNTTTGQNHEIEITIKNQPLINLSGYVWEDELAHIEGKYDLPPDGVFNQTETTYNKNGNTVLDDYVKRHPNEDFFKYSKENGVEGVRVYVREYPDWALVRGPVYTDKNGHYIFKDLDKLPERSMMSQEWQNANKEPPFYSVSFEYNGIKYIETSDYAESDECKYQFKDFFVDYDENDESWTEGYGWWYREFYDRYSNWYKHPINQSIAREWDDDANNNHTRRDFNNKFKTIYGEGALVPYDLPAVNGFTLGRANDPNHGIPLKYNSVKDLTYGMWNSTLDFGKWINTSEGYSGKEIERVDGYNNPANTGTVDNSDFMVFAETSANDIPKNDLWSTRYNTTTGNINCGLVQKSFDLEVALGIDNIKTTVNNKTTNEVVEDTNGEEANNDSEESPYNLILSKADYNYRVVDYKHDSSETELLSNPVHPEDQSVINSTDEAILGSELEVIPTYKVTLKNMGFADGYVNEFVFYYNNDYLTFDHCFKGILDENGNPKRNEDGSLIEDTDIGYEVKDNKDGTGPKVTLTLKEDNIENCTIKSSDNMTIYFSFKVNKDGDKFVKTTNPNDEKSGIVNVVELNSYSTVIGGYVDENSAPGNADVFYDTLGNPSAEYHEDDDARSRALRILVEDSRTITGTVFEDSRERDGNPDGKLGKDKEGNDETPVDDVIVQLIEIKNFEGKNYEHVWQETRSGHGEVETSQTEFEYDSTDHQVDEWTSYFNEGIEHGQYMFKDFIPGNYIIRYIYGDGSTDEITYEYINSADNIKKYNGQDYKSTIDKYYGDEWYNEDNYDNNASRARDNEARRLEVMAYSATIDNAKGNALEKKEDLDKTWMCAETSKLNIPVKSTKSTINGDKNSVILGSSEVTISYSLQVDNMNFGLTLRPRTDLSLEKHITSLTIKPSSSAGGVSSVVEANVPITDILNYENPQAKGTTQNLTINKASRDNRGFWMVATDISELMQGANLDVEYTYVITNNGERDYLSNELIEEYEANPEDYSNYLTAKAGENWETFTGNTHTYGEFLGKYYYTGVSDGCALVPTRIEAEGLEEAVNNDLAFVEAPGDDFTDKGSASKNVYDEEAQLLEKKITTVIKNKTESKYLIPVDDSRVDGDDTMDYSKKVMLTKTLSATQNGEPGAVLPSYIAEITLYSNAAGRRDMDSIPGNLGYVHSDDTTMTLNSVTVNDGSETTDISKDDLNNGYRVIRNANEDDEFWAETITITKPTGEDKLTPMQIALITTGSIAVLGVGIFLIKKFVLKK